LSVLLAMVLKRKYLGAVLFIFMYCCMLHLDYSLRISHGINFSWG